MNELEQAALDAAEHGAPAKVWHVGLDPVVDLGAGRNPFDGASITHWSVD